jgi:predicted RNA binding protein YcfA (HicA-like mRNA interferase family)
LERGNNIITFAMKSKELIKLLMRAGWFKVRQSGSHVIMRHLIEDKQIVVPMHGGKDVHEGLLREIFRMAGLNRKGKHYEKN